MWGVAMKIIAAVVPATRKPFQVEEVDLEEPRSDETWACSIEIWACNTVANANANANVKVEVFI